MQHTVRTPFLLLGASALIAAASMGCRTGADGGSGEREVVILEHGSAVDGRLEVGSLLVKAGTEVRVPADLHVISRGDVRIDGVLRAADRDHTDVQRDAPRIRIEAGGKLRVGESGAVLGGRGAKASSAGLPGGRGTEFTLVCRSVHVEGRLLGGAGGDAGPGGPGGAGGDVRIRGRGWSGHGQLRGGPGGRGGEMLQRDIFDPPSGPPGRDGTVRLISRDQL